MLRKLFYCMWRIQVTVKLCVCRVVYLNCIYRSIPGKRPLLGKHPGSYFGRVNGERPLPGKCPGILQKASANLQVQ